MVNRVGPAPVLLVPLITVIVFFAMLIPANASIVTLEADVYSGVAPLEVNFTCRIDTMEPVLEYWMDYGDGSPVEIIESDKLSATFNHTYSGGLFNPVCTVIRNLGGTDSDPIQIIVAKWQFKTGGDVDSSPAIGPDGTIFVGSDDGNLYAVSPNGTEVARFKTGGRVQSSPSIDDNGIIYIGSEDGNLYALRFLNGEFIPRWSQPFNTGDAIFSTPAIGPDGSIYIGSSNGNLYAVHPEGTPRFGFPFTAGGKIISSPAIGYDGIQEIVYFGCLDKNVYAVTADNGTLKWKFPTNATVYGSPAIGSDGRIYIGEVQTGSALEYNYNFYSINIDGTLNWNVNVGSGVYGSPAIGANGAIFVGSWDGVFYAFAWNGKKMWSINRSFDMNASPAIALGNIAYIGSKDEYFYAFQPPSVEEELRKDWKFKADGAIQKSSPVIGPDGTIYFGSQDDYLYAINPGGITLADSAWPMFQGGVEHRGYNDSIQISDVISTQPSRLETGVGIETSEVRVNFAPGIRKEQVDFASFKLFTVANDQEVAGYASLPNEPSYNLGAVFYVYEEALAYDTEYRGTINYTDAVTLEPKTYTWTFTTEAEEEEDPDPDPEPDFCFIGALKY